MNARMHVDVPTFSATVNRYAAASGKSIEEAFKEQARLLAKELIDRTPPLSGKAIKRQMQGKSFSDPSTENMSARKVGERALAGDMGKVFAPIMEWQNVKLTSRGSQGGGARTDKERVFLYRMKDGMLACTEPGMFNPSPTVGWMRSIKVKFRGLKGKGKGRVKAAQGKKEGRIWFNLRKYPVPMRLFDSVLKETLKRVGAAKGGWIAAFRMYGGKAGSGGWIGKHTKEGSAIPPIVTKGGISIEFANRSSWVTTGEGDWVLIQSLRGRAAKLAKLIEMKLKEQWGFGKGRKL